MRDLNREIGNRLRAARIAAGFRTAKSFSDRLGIPQPTYSTQETGKRGLTRENLLLYADKLNVSLAWLMTGSGAMRGADVPVLGSEAAPGTAGGARSRGAKGPPARPRNRLGEFLVQKGVDGRELAKRTGIAQKRLAAIADGAEVTQAELDLIADALDLGVFDLFDFAPLTRDEAALVIDLRRMDPDDRRHLQAVIDAMRGHVANDARQHPGARKKIA